MHPESPLDALTILGPRVPYFLLVWGPRTRHSSLRGISLTGLFRVKFNRCFRAAAIGWDPSENCHGSDCSKEVWTTVTAWDSTGLWLLGTARGCDCWAQHVAVETARGCGDSTGLWGQHGAVTAGDSDGYNQVYLSTKNELLVHF